MSECDFVVESPFLGWLSGKRSGWQFGEQGLLVAIAEAIGESIPRTCIEIGAGDGDALPVTIEPLYQDEWRTYLIETDDEKLAAIAKRFSEATAAKKIEFAADEPVGVLVIDIDGEDSSMMRDALIMDVSVLMVEHMDRHIPLPSTTPDPLPGWALGLVLRDGFILQDTHQAINEIAHSNGYERVCMTRVNSIFVRRDLFPLLYRQMDSA